MGDCVSLPADYSASQDQVFFEVREVDEGGTPLSPVPAISNFSQINTLNLRRELSPESPVTDEELFTDRSPPTTRRDSTASVFLAVAQRESDALNPDANLDEMLPRIVGSTNSLPPSFAETPRNVEQRMADFDVEAPLSSYDDDEYRSDVVPDEFDYSLDEPVAFYECLNVATPRGPADPHVAPPSTSPFQIHPASTVKAK